MGQQISRRMFLKGDNTIRGEQKRYPRNKRGILKRSNFSLCNGYERGNR